LTPRFKKTPPNKRAVILAGGKGSRLGPYTTVLPKPLLPVGDRAILDLVVHKLRSHDFTDLILAVGYLGHLIRAVFGDGRQRGVNITYYEEGEPLGTAGPLGEIDGLDDTFLMMNGDILTTLDYSELYDIHRDAGNMLTIATHRRVVQADYGVLHLDGDLSMTQRVTGFDEKPEIPYIVSMGVYVVEPEVLDYIPSGEWLQLPDLVLKLLAAGEQVGSYLYDGFWLDIGRHEDYEKAINEYESLKPLLLAENGLETFQPDGKVALAPPVAP
jgi:NDP-sugar pyrophosphorylase family protein